ncbi:MAG: SDR family NAD(P)-dependent oxidoreductase, partial [Crocosphaera sp.]
PGGLKNEDNSNSILLSSADTLFEGTIPRTKVAQVCVDSLFKDEYQQRILEIVTQPDNAEVSS